MPNVQDTSVSSNHGDMKLEYSIDRAKKAVIVKKFTGIPQSSATDFWNSVRREMGVFVTRGFQIIMDEMENPTAHYTIRFKEKVGALLEVTQ